MFPSIFSRGGFVPVIALFLVSCGGDGGSTGLSDILTSLEVTPSAATIFNTAPGNSVTVAVTPLNQDGDPMSGLGNPVFESGNAAVATVTPAGIITAVAVGTTSITVSVTDDGTTVSRTVSVTVKVAPVVALVTAPQFVFLPDTVHISAGGDVTWSVGAIHHAVQFLMAGSPADTPELLNSSATRTFPTAGSYPYKCPIHATMFGVVHVH